MSETAESPESPPLPKLWRTAEAEINDVNPSSLIGK